MSDWGGLCSLMGQGQQLGSERCTTSSGACVLCVLMRHLMGSAGCGAARLKSQSVEGSAACYRIGAIIHSLPRASLPPGSSFRPPVLVGVDRLRRFELRAVPKHGVHDDGEPPGERDPCLSQGRPLGNGQRPVLRFQWSLVARQHDVRGLVEQGSHSSVAAFEMLPV